MAARRHGAKERKRAERKRKKRARLTERGAAGRGKRLKVRVAQRVEEALEYLYPIRFQTPA